MDEELKRLLAAADIVLGNLETPVLPRRSSLGEALAFHCLSEDDLDAWLAALGLLHPAKATLALSVANNHCFDSGMAGLQATLDACHRRSIVALGVAPAAGEPLRPTELRPGVSALAWTHWLNRDPYPSCAGGVLRHWQVREASPEQLQSPEGITLGLPHWGYEFDFWPDAGTQADARAFLAQGLHGLFGAHSHTAQPIELIEGRVCAYSLGDFNGFSGPAWLQRSDVCLGQLLEVQLSRHGIQKVTPHWLRWDPAEAALGLSSEGPAALRF